MILEVAQASRPAAAPVRVKGERWVCGGLAPGGRYGEAFSVFVPRGWTADGEVRWDRCGAEPAVRCRFRAASPDGRAEVTLLAGRQAPGQAPDPAAYLLADALPAARPGLGPVHVVGVRSAARTPWPLSGTTRSTSAAVTCAYVAGGFAWHEEATVAIGRTDAGWVAAPALAMRALADDFELWRGVLEAVVDSFTVDTALAARA